jgi:hypothetical protein
MFDGLEAQASEVMELVRSYGAYNIRFSKTTSYEVLFCDEGYLTGTKTRTTVWADHDDTSSDWLSELQSLLSTLNIELFRKYRVLKVGERPAFLEYGEQRLDLIEDDSVVYLVVQSDHEGSLSNLLEEHTEWTGRVQVVVITLGSEKVWDDWYETAVFKVHGAGARKEGTFSNQWTTSYELKGKDFYILNHKVVWKGQVTDRDVAADINSLLAGNQLVVLTERVPEVKLPKYEEVESKLHQVRGLYESFCMDESGVIRFRPSLKFSGSKFFSEVSLPIEKFSCELSGSPDTDFVEQVKKYFGLLEAIKELFPYVQSKADN